jgi:drug/metabolite transporter (DMT)-like permease
MNSTDDGQNPAGQAAGLMLIVLSLIWGVSWPLMKFALIEIPPFSMRVSTAGLGAVTLVIYTRLSRRSIAIRSPKAFLHVVIASFLNIVCFSLLTAVAQVHASTSRVTVLVYTMPIWAALLSRPILGERLTRPRAIGLALCVCGLSILAYPHLQGGLPLGMVLAVIAGLCWAAGTVYLKWARIEADPMAVTSWQLIIAFVIIAVCLLPVEGGLHVWPVGGLALFGLLYSGVLGVGFAYILWFAIVGRLPATAAALGILSVPALGVLSSMLMLGERPTSADVVGFALIVAAAACVLVPTRRTA